MTPDTSEIRRDLDFMTARWHELDQPLWLEVRAFKPGCSPATSKYRPEPTWLQEAADWIADFNRRGYNTYAVRNPIKDTLGGRSASDSDIAAAYYLWADCDDEAAASNVHRFTGPKWSAAVVTGRVPSTRVHTYWELREPCTDMAAWRDMQSAIAAHFGSDGSVINPSRIMRIGGTVTWPDDRKRGRGYTSEVATLRTEYDDDRAPVTMDQMARVFSASQPAPQQSTAGSFQVDTGREPLDRERLAIQAMEGQEWHNAVIRLVASYVGKGLSDGEIHALTAPLTLSGYTVEQTRQEVQTAIDGARRKGWAPEQSYATLDTAPSQTGGAEFDTPARPIEIEWYDDIEPALVDSYLIKNFLGASAMSVIYGPSNSGKTFLALDIAFHVSIGAAWRARKVHRAAVLYLAAEGGRGVINRVAALKKEHGVCDVPMAIKRAGMDLLHDKADLKHVVELASAVQSRAPGAPLLIVVDTLSRIMAGGDENSAADMTAIIRNIDAIREATGAHVMLVHHTGKDAARGARGHSSLRAATDTEIEVANEDGQRAAMVTKQRDYQGGETFAFALKSVPLGFDQDGDEVSSCVVEVADADEFRAAKNAKKGLGGTQEIVLNTIDQMIAEGLWKPNPGGVGMPETGQFKCVDRAELRRICMGKISAADPRSSFNKAISALADGRGLLACGENMVWRIDRKVNQ